MRRRTSLRSHRVIEPLESRVLLASTLYVDINSPGPAHNGASWDTAHLNPRTRSRSRCRATRFAWLMGHTSRRAARAAISPSTSRPGELLGGYAGYGTADPDARDIVANQTIFSGDIGTPGNNTDNSVHVVVGSGTDATAVIDGFSITAGNASGSSSRGGGMYNSAGSPTVTNCTFGGNAAGSAAACATPPPLRR